MPLFTFADILDRTRDAAREQFRIPPSQVVVLNDSASASKPGPIAGPLVVLGHTQEVIKEGAFTNSRHQTVGGLTVKQMVGKFKEQIPASADRKNVKDIYLIACEAGWNDSKENPCYAKRLATALHKAGFDNIQVHAIASPAGSANEFTGMRVSLLSQTGVTDITRDGERFGHASAFVCTPKHSALEAEIEQLKKRQEVLAAKQPESMSKAQWHTERTRVNTQIWTKTREKNAEAKAHSIMSSDNLMMEMHRPENTYRHGFQTLQADLGSKLEAARQFRPSLPFPASSSSQSASSAPVVDTKSALIEELNELRSGEQSKSKFLQDINSLMEKINASPDWQQTIFDEMDAYHKSGIKARFTDRDNSNFYGLLVHLVKGHDLNRSDALATQATEVKQKLDAAQFPVDKVIINRSKKSSHVTVFRDDRQFEFKLKNKAGIDKGIQAFLKEQKHTVPGAGPQADPQPKGKGKGSKHSTKASATQVASGSQADVQPKGKGKNSKRKEKAPVGYEAVASRSKSASKRKKKSKEPSSSSSSSSAASLATILGLNPLLAPLVTAKIMSPETFIQGARITSEPREIGGEIHLTMTTQPGERTIAATLDSQQYEQQVETMVTILEQLHSQRISYNSLSIKAGAEGLQVALDGKPAQIVRNDSLQSDVAGFAPQVTVTPVVLPPQSQASMPAAYRSEPPQGNTGSANGQAEVTPPESPARSRSSSFDSVETGDISHTDEDSLADQNEPLNQSNFSHHYAYGGAKTTRKSHIWNKASVNADARYEFLLEADRSLTGDKLKRAILDAFAERLNICARDNPGGLTQLKDAIRDSPEAQILKTSQGFTTCMFKLFKNTDSANALNEMLNSVETPGQKGPG